MVLINLDNVDTVTQSDDDTATISFVTGVEDYINTTETYEEVRSKIACLCKGYYANPTD